MRQTRCFAPLFLTHFKELLQTHKDDKNDFDNGDERLKVNGTVPSDFGFRINCAQNKSANEKDRFFLSLFFEMQTKSKQCWIAHDCGKIFIPLSKLTHFVTIYWNDAIRQKFRNDLFIKWIKFLMLFSLPFSHFTATVWLSMCIYFKGRNFNFTFCISRLFFSSLASLETVFWPRITFVSYLAYYKKVNVFYNNEWTEPQQQQKKEKKLIMWL